MDWLIDPFSEPELQRALVSGVLAAIEFAAIGTWVVIRGMTFLGDALAHGIIPGVALAILFGFSPVVGAAIAAVVMRVPTMMVTAAGIGAASVATGLVISYHLGTSGSATMALVPIVEFFVLLAAKTLGQERLKAQRSESAAV